jgi:hypothetical protein
MANPLEIEGHKMMTTKLEKKNPHSSIHSHIGDKFHFQVPFHSSIICNNSLGTRFKNKKTFHNLTSTLGHVAISVVFKCSLAKPWS